VGASNVGVTLIDLSQGHTNPYAGRKHSMSTLKRSAAVFFAVGTLLASSLALSEEAPNSVLSWGRTLGMEEGREPNLVFIAAGVLRNPMNLTSMTESEKCNQATPIVCPPLPGLQVAYSLTLGIGLVPSTLLFVDLQAVTGFSNFNPQPSIGVGPAILVVKGFMLNPQLVYSPTFYYSNGAPSSARPAGAPGETNHTIGLSLAAGFLRRPVLVAPLVCVAYNATSEQWFLLLAIKVGAPLSVL